MDRTPTKKSAAAAAAQARGRPGAALTLGQAFEVAVAFHRRGRLRQAEQAYRTVLRAVPAHPGALHHLGILCTQLGRPGEAIEHLRAAAAADPNAAGVHNDLGIALAALRRPEEAIDEYAKAIALDPGQVDARNNLGNALLALKRPEQAVACFEQALAVRPHTAGVHNNLANALIELDRLDQAVEHYRAALAIRPDFPEASNNLGMALSKLKRPTEAIGQFEKAIAVKPGYADAYKNLAWTLAASGNHEAAIGHFQTALAINPEDADTQNALGNALAVLGRETEAIVRYSRALALRPDSAEAYNNLGNSLAALNRHEDAITHFRTALAIKPELIETHGNLGGSLEALERTGEAIACYEAVLARDPDNARAHHLRGYALRAMGRLEESQTAFERAVSLDGGKAEFYRGLAESRRFTADDPHLGAMEQLARDMESQPAEWRIQLNFALAKAYEDLGRHEESFRHLVAGNALKRQRVAYDEAETLDAFRRMAAAFTLELMQKKQRLGDPSDLPVFIVGMPRSGTTLVEQVLASHPKVHAAGEITDFNLAAASVWRSATAAERFPESIASATPAQFRALAARYLGALRARAPVAERIADKALSNFQFAGLIHLALPHARIIHVRRDPVDTCVSAFSKLFTTAQAHTFDLAELGRYYRAYDTLMTHWRQVLPDGVMLEVQYEELVADFAPQARRIVAHCGLEWDERCLAYHETQRVVRTASAVQVRQPLYRSAVGRARPYAAMLGPLLEALRSDDGGHRTEDGDSRT